MQELSDREIEILRLLGQGKSNKELAQELFISVNTVKVHLSNIFKKLGVSSRTEATLFAIEHKIIDSPISETETIKIFVPRYEKETLESGKAGAFISKYRWATIISAVFLLLIFSTLISQSSLFYDSTPTINPLIDTINQEYWREMEPLSTAREQMAVVAWNDVIYAIGGLSEVGVSDMLEAYLRSSNSWTTLQPKPTAVKAAGAAVLGGKVYVPGGQQADNSLSNKLEVYDPLTDQWETKASLPIPLANYGIASYEGNLYLFGGWDGLDETDLVLRYNPNNDNWTEMTLLPTARSSSSAIVLGDSIFVVGGIVNGQPCLANEVYSPNLDNGSNNPWSRQLSLDNDVQFIGGQTVLGTLFLFSVEKNGNIRIQNFAPQNNMWSSYSEEPVVVPSKKSQVLSLSGNIFFLGGVNEEGKPSKRVVRYQAVFTIVLPMIVN
jgi:DNA-binding CsgD family transcriptional regulator/N-acetylneuraminic acid mutarotase